MYENTIKIQSSITFSYIQHIDIIKTCVLIRHKFCKSLVKLCVIKNKFHTILLYYFQTQGNVFDLFKCACLHTHTHTLLEFVIFFQTLYGGPSIMTMLLNANAAQYDIFFQVQGSVIDLTEKTVQKIKNLSHRGSIRIIYLIFGKYSRPLHKLVYAGARTQTITTTDDRQNSRITDTQTFLRIV